MDTTSQDTPAVSAPAHVPTKAELRMLGEAAAILSRIDDAARDAGYARSALDTLGQAGIAGAGRIAERAEAVRDGLYSLMIACDVYARETHASDRLRKYEDRAKARQGA